MDLVDETFAECGFPFNDKGSLEPSETVCYTGLIINSSRKMISLTPGKRSRVEKMLHFFAEASASVIDAIPIWEIESYAGVISHVASIFRHLRVVNQPWYEASTYRGSRPKASALSNSAKKMLNIIEGRYCNDSRTFWDLSFLTCFPKPGRDNQPSTECLSNPMVILTDAEARGRGAVIYDGSFDRMAMHRWYGDYQPKSYLAEFACITELLSWLSSNSWKPVLPRNWLQPSP